MAKTPLHAFRIPDELYLPALERARQEHLALAAVVRQFLRAYAAGHIVTYPLEPDRSTVTERDDVTVGH